MKSIKNFWYSHTRDIGAFDSENGSPISSPANERKSYFMASLTIVFIVDAFDSPCHSAMYPISAHTILRWFDVIWRVSFGVMKTDLHLSISERSSTFSNTRPSSEVPRIVAFCRPYGLYGKSLVCFIVMDAGNVLKCGLNLVNNGHNQATRRKI